jgi:hypothetical protein
MSISLRDRIIKRKEEEDDDMMSFLFPALYLMGFTRGVRKKHHTSEETGEARLRFVDSSRDMSRTAKFTFRMEPHIFRDVVTYLRRRRLVINTMITVEEKLGFFLYMLSHSASYEDLQVFFGHNNDTFHQLRWSFPHSLAASFSLLILIKCSRKFKTIIDSILSSRTVSVPLMELTFLFPYLLRNILLLEIGREH